jgi:hypothetical protein
VLDRRLRVRLAAGLPRRRHAAAEHAERGRGELHGPALSLLVDGEDAADEVPDGRVGLHEQEGVAAEERPVEPVVRLELDRARRVATLTVTSEPRATLFIDGTEVGETPIVGRPLVVGRTYLLRIQRDGYRTKRELVTANNTSPIRRRFVLRKE